MIKGKSGAIELSITTIVVVVIGVTLLALGLAWVSGIFEKLQGTTKGAFEKADAEIGNIFAGGTQDKPFRLSPTEISIKQGGRGRATLILSYLVSGPQVNNIQAKRPSGNTDSDSTNTYKNKVKCIFADTGTAASKSYTLNSGQEAKLGIYVDVDRDTPLGNYLCNFEQVNVPDVVTGQQEPLYIVVTK